MSRIEEIKDRLCRVKEARVMYALSDYGTPRTKIIERSDARTDAFRWMAENAEEDLWWLIEENRRLDRAATGLADAILKMAAASERGVGEMMMVGTRETARIMEELRIGRTLQEPRAESVQCEG